MGMINYSEFGEKVSPVDNERGMALIIVLMMLLLLSILGASMLSSSTSELKIAGNYRNSEESFYTADAALELAQTYANIYLNDFASSPVWPMPGQGKDLGEDLIHSDLNVTNGKNADFLNYNRITFIGANGNVNKADVKVELTGSGPPPAGSGIQEDSGISPGSTSYKANYFAISVIGYGPNNTTAKLESQLAKIVQQ
jgi:hypothetical protein